MLSECIPPLGEVLSFHIPVIQAVNNENACLNIRHVLQIVTLVPKVIVITGSAILILTYLVHNVFTHLWILTCQNVTGQNVSVLTLITTGSDDCSVGTIVVVPTANSGNRYDRLETFDTCRGNAIWQCTVVRNSDHANVSGRPIGSDFTAVRCKCLSTSVQPVNNGFRTENLVFVTRSRTTVRSPGANAVTENDSVTARYVIIT